MNIDLGLSIAGPAFRFGPEFLFLSGEDGTATGNPFEAFTDTGGTTAADFGDAIARINDRSPNARNALQSSSALRPLLGRAPVAGRRNIWDDTINTGAIVGTPGTLPSLWTEAESASGITVSVVGLGQESGLAFIDLRFQGTASGGRTTLQHQAAIPIDGGNYTYSFFAKIVAGTTDNISRLQGRFFITGDTNQSVGNFSFPTSGEMERFSGAVDAGSGTGIRGGLAVEVGTGPVDVTIRYAGYQLERGETLTPYQRTAANGLDITETGFPSPAFIRPDLSDDVLPTEFPDGFTGDVMVFGRKGSWIEQGVEIASAGSLNIGPETFTGAPDGVLAALGDIVGWVAVERTLTDFEVARLVQYHKARGAKGLLVPGPELVTNGDFADGISGWTAVPATTLLSASGGAMTVTIGADHAISGTTRAAQEVPLDAGRFYLFDGEHSALQGPGARYGVGTGALSTGDRSMLESSVISSPGEFTRVFQATESPAFVRLFSWSNVAGSGDFVTFERASIRELRPQEDW